MASVRFIEESDVQRVLDIYSPFVESTAISFEITSPSLEDFKGRVFEVTQTHPWLVYESENHIAGFAYAAPHRVRKAYDWVSEVSVYIDPFYQKRGIGPLLYEKLFLSLKNLGYYQALAGITLPNPPSEKLHQMMGFQKVGVYPKIGFKMGKWQDVIWYQKELQQGQPHSAPKTFSSMRDKNKLLL